LNIKELFRINTFAAWLKIKYDTLVALLEQFSENDVVVTDP
jgi:hypothetical protein